MKTKMVRMVHRNLFYDMELRICDPKMELWRETEKHDFQKMKNLCWYPTLNFDAISKTKMISKQFLDLFGAYLGPSDVYLCLLAAECY